MRILETSPNSAFCYPFLGTPLFSIMSQKSKGPQGQNRKSASRKPCGTGGGIYGLPEIARATPMKWTKNFLFRGM